MMRAIDVACVTLSGCSQIDGEPQHLLPSRDSVMHGRWKFETRWKKFTGRSSKGQNDKVGVMMS